MAENENWERVLSELYAITLNKTSSSVRKCYENRNLYSIFAAESSKIITLNCYKKKIRKKSFQRNDDRSFIIAFQFYLFNGLHLSYFE